MHKLICTPAPKLVLCWCFLYTKSDILVWLKICDLNIVKFIWFCKQIENHSTKVGEFYIRHDKTHWCFCALLQGLSQRSSMQTQSQHLQPAPETVAEEIITPLQKVSQTEVSVLVWWQKYTLYVLHSLKSQQTQGERRVGQLHGECPWGEGQSPKWEERLLGTSYVMSFCLGGLWMFLTTHFTIHSMPSFTPSLHENKYSGFSGISKFFGTGKLQGSRWQNIQNHHLLLTGNWQQTLTSSA